MNDTFKFLLVSSMLLIIPIINYMEDKPFHNLSILCIGSFFLAVIGWFLTEHERKQ